MYIYFFSYEMSLIGLEKQVEGGRSSRNSILEFLLLGGMKEKEVWGGGSMYAYKAFFEILICAGLLNPTLWRG